MKLKHSGCFFCLSSYRQSPLLGPLLLSVQLGRREVDDSWAAKTLGDYLEYLNIFRSVRLDGIHLRVLQELAEVMARLNHL